MSIIVNLDVLMAKRKMSLNELSERVDITVSNLSILKTGKAKAVRFSTLESLCRELDCQPGDILEYTSDKHHKKNRKLKPYPTMAQHPHTEHAKHESPKSALSLAFWLNFGFSIIELIGGILTNSTAIITDAFHDFMDAGAIGLALLLEKISDKKRTEQFSYGFKRFSLLSALALSLILLIGAGTMIVTAYRSLFNPKEVYSVGMLLLAFLGIVINGTAYLKIKKDGNASHHGHHHAPSENNHNSRSVMLHLLEDVLGWIAILIGATVIYWTGWNWIDGILAITIAVFIGYNAVKNLLSTVKVMLQSVPENVDIESLVEKLKLIKGVIDIHDVHIWSLDGSSHVGSLHAVTDGSEKDILPKIITLMQEYDIAHPTVQIEREENHCGLEDC